MIPWIDSKRDHSTTAHVTHSPIHVWTGSFHMCLCSCLTWKNWWIWMSRGKCLLRRFCLRMRRRSGTLSSKATTSHAYFQREPNVSPMYGVTYDMIFQSINLSILALQNVCHHQFQVPACRMYVLNIHMLSCMAKRSSQKSGDVYGLSGWFKLRYDVLGVSLKRLCVSSGRNPSLSWALYNNKTKTCQALTANHQSKTYPTISCQWLQSRFLFEKKTQQHFHPTPQRKTNHPFDALKSNIQAIVLSHGSHL